jgi:hypothetical protein
MGVIVGGEELKATVFWSLVCGKLKQQIVSC